MSDPAPHPALESTPALVKPALSAIPEETPKSSPSAPIPAALHPAVDAADTPPMTPNDDKPKEPEVKKVSTDALPPTPAAERPPFPALPGLDAIAGAGSPPTGNPFSPPFKLDDLLTPATPAAGGLPATAGLGSPFNPSDALASRYAELGLPSAAQQMSLLEFERHKEVLRKSHEQLDKVCPVRLIPPREYKFFISHISRALAQNTLDRGVQTNPERSKRYRDGVEWNMKEMYPLLRPALGLIGKVVEAARLESEEDMALADARLEEKTLKFEGAVLRRIKQVEEEEQFKHTEIDGRNLNKELVEDLRRKLERRIEHRRTRNTLVAHVENSSIRVGEVEKLIAEEKEKEKGKEERGGQEKDGLSVTPLVVLDPPPVI